MARCPRRRGRLRCRPTASCGRPRPQAHHLGRARKVESSCEAANDESNEERSAHWPVTARSLAAGRCLRVPNTPFPFPCLKKLDSTRQPQGIHESHADSARSWPQRRARLCLHGSSGKRGCRAEPQNHACNPPTLSTLLTPHLPLRFFNPEPTPPHTLDLCMDNRGRRRLGRRVRGNHRDPLADGLCNPTRREDRNGRAQNPPRRRGVTVCFSNLRHGRCSHRGRARSVRQISLEWWCGSSVAPTGVANKFQKRPFVFGGVACTSLGL